MKKKIMVLAVAIASMASFSSMAQVAAKATSGVETVKCDNASNECCNLKKDCMGGNAFEGINLTADQQSKLKALKADCKAKREKCNADKKAAKAQARADRKQAKRDYLNKVKGILTPDQYVVFLENIVVSDAPKGGPRPNGHHNGKGMKVNDLKRDASRQSTQSARVAK